MKILHISNNDNDGAGRAASRLNHSLNSIGLDSRLLVLYKKNDDKYSESLGSGKTFKELLLFITKNFFLVKPASYYELIILFKFRFKLIIYNLYYKPNNLFNFQIIAFNLKHIIPYLKNVDAIIFHSIQEMISIEDIAKIYKEYNIKIIFHPLDMEMLTGGYHFTYDCKCYKLGHCNSIDHNLDVVAKKIYQKKIKYFSHIPIKWVTTSNFTKNRLLKSKIFNNNHTVNTIYMGIEIEKTIRILKSDARKKLNISDDKKIILFGCFDFNDPRKGAKILNKIIQNYVIPKTDTNSILLLTYGTLNSFSFSNLDIDWNHLGYIETSQRMNLLYRASDLMLSPSLDDIGPTTVQEAFANSLPVVGFDIGFISDLINRDIQGKKVNCFNEEQFGKFIVNYLNAEDIMPNEFKNNIDFSPNKEAELFYNVLKKNS